MNKSEVIEIQSLDEKEISNMIEEHLKKVDEDTEIRISTMPNYINKKILKLIRKYKIKTIELEIQSTNNYILEKIGANYNFNDIKRSSKLIRRYGFRLGHKIMVGLQDSTKIDEINTAKTVLKLKPKIVSIVPVLVIKGTNLEKEYNEKKYKPLTLVQAVETCEEMVKVFNNKKIEVIVIGYDETDESQSELAKKVVDGPFHPAFRQLVESSLWYDAIVNKIKQLNVKVMQVEVTVNPIDTENVIGYKQENINKLKELYDVELIVTSDENIKQGKSKIEVTKTYQDFKSE